MRHPAYEKLEIIELVEHSHLPVRRSVEKLGIPRSSFGRWCDTNRIIGSEVLENRSRRPGRE